MHTTVHGRIGYVAVEGNELILRGHGSTTYQRFTLTPEAKEAISECIDVAEDLSSWDPYFDVQWDDTEGSRLKVERSSRRAP